MSSKLLSVAAILVAVAVAGSAAHAQLRSQRQLGEGEVLVQAQRNLTLRPGQGADDSKFQEDAIRMIYRMAERECTLILETIGTACELASISTSVQSGDEGSANPFVRASGSFSMRVKLKD